MWIEFVFYEIQATKRLSICQRQNRESIVTIKVGLRHPTRKFYIQLSKVVKRLQNSCLKISISAIENTFLNFICRRTRQKFSYLSAFTKSMDLFLSIFSLRSVLIAVPSIPPPAIFYSTRRFSFKSDVHK